MSFQLGENTLKVSAKLFALNRQRLVNELKKIVDGKKNVVLLQGGIEKNRYNTDSADLPFRQESYFFWTFGVHESDFYGAIDVDSGRTMLFAPKLHPDYIIWEGKIHPETWFKEKYEVDEVHFHENGNIENYLKMWNAQKLLLLSGVNSDSNDELPPANFIGKNNFEICEKTLYPIMSELRVFKTDMELEVMRYAAKIACDAHKDVMKNIKPGWYEYQGESLFRHHSYFHGGCRHLAYTCIGASGENSSILHYGHVNAPNSRKIKDGDMCLFDMGPEYNCYASDVTSSFPVNGKFTKKQKGIYNAVLAANKTVFENAKPGVSYVEMHLLAERVILKHLKEIGIVKGEIDEMMKVRLGAVFQPHGLGHFLGLDVHDCGGYLGDAIPRSTLPGLKSLRCTRTLQERMVITIEPGCYFIDSLLDKALSDPDQAKFLNKNVLEEYRGFGGVRIEDDVIIWKNGNENMSILPRTVEEIENFMKH
ncbi:Xaa-Pro dipeptidase [Strongyloides ratti]|uniref:Xaa-Pro dipeptidase n=1 Tax=Strongyloides ratti TaxID=34506 RepID=A0A090LDZ2_STRRB|nr:Xaa-Pro dipeptidase [Strongyloides ratti]CEF68016.1 Xaa-Pro dipeptidase [Strongyloides ratti]